MPIGVKVTLRKDRMYEFLDRLVTIALPRVRDFRGADRRRASTAAATTRMGLKEHIVFVEIDYDKTETVWGMDIIIQHHGEDRRRSARRCSPASSSRS